MMNRILRNGKSRLLAVAIACVFSLLAVAPERAEASAGHVLLGGLAGAGIVLAWPTITAGVGAICAGIGSVAAGATAAVAAGGAAVGGAVAGVGAAAGTAVTGAFGAIGGAIAAVTASPLFVPALVVIAAVIAGVLIYRAIKKKNENKPIRISDANTNVTGGGRIVDDGKDAKDSKDSKSKSGPTVVTFYDSKGGANPNAVSGGTTDPREAHERYQAAYRRYIEALQKDDTGTKSETQQALQELRSAEETYRRLVNTASAK